MQPLELYIHIPFCVKKCAYCDFLSGPAGEQEREDYVNLLAEEIRNCPDAVKDYEVVSIFFGGGTPSLLTGEQMERLMDVIRETFTLGQDAEITMEMNPGTVEEEKLRKYRQAGVNRLSIGLQSVNDEELRLLGRIHTYEEFLEAADTDLFEKYKLLGKKLDSVTGAELKSWYDIYCQIGGYPSVVREYLNSKSIERARSELIRIIDTFMNESIRYFTDVLDTQVFTDIFLSICRILGREKKGLEEDSISEELQKLVTRDYSSNISKAVCNRAISWLRFCGVIGFCGKIIEMDILNFKPGCRCYFMDLGLASYYMARVGAAQTEIAGMLSENFVYINLKKRQDFPEEIAFEMPAFATFKGGEVDFVVQGLKSSRKYAIEVKTGKHIEKTKKKVLESGKADCLLYLKGDTLGGQEGKIETVPIYLLEKLNF